MRARTLISMVVATPMLLVATVACSGSDSGSGTTTTAASTTAPAGATTSAGATSTVPEGATTTGASSTTAPGGATTAPAAATTAPPAATTAPGTTNKPTTTRPQPTTTTTPSQADAAILAFLKRFNTDRELATQVIGTSRAALAPNGNIDFMAGNAPALREPTLLTLSGTSGTATDQTAAAWKVVQALAGFWNSTGGFRNDNGQVRVGLQLVLDGVTIETPYDVMIAVADGRYGQAEWEAATNGE